MHEYYLPKDNNISDYARSDAYGWIIRLWDHSGHARFVSINDNYFKTLSHHPIILEGIKHGWILVEHTSIHFPLIGFSIISRSRMLEYNLL